MTGPRRLALRFISGKYQGGEFPIVERKEIVVGRSSDLDMVLVEDMVSRRHARIGFEADQIIIEDLGSTNGTFVNGQKIKRTPLKEGDRVLIGTNILKVIALDNGAAPQIQSARRELADVAAERRAVAPSRGMSGAIEEIPLPDLLQLLGSSKKSGVLVIRSGENVARIFLRRGNVTFASLNDREDAPPLKTAYRVLAWTKGTFDLEPPDERTMPGEINVSVQEILMESLRQIDELNALRQRLPAATTRFVLSVPLRGKLRDLTADELDVLQLALESDSLDAVIQSCPLTDLEAAQTLQRLLASHVLKPA